VLLVLAARLDIFRVAVVEIIMPVGQAEAALADIGRVAGVVGEVLIDIDVEGIGDADLVGLAD
jgi:hypothetical protein